MTATVTVSGLTSGLAYSLFRYDDYTAVPSAASAADYASSSYMHRTDFTATGSAWSFVDPNTRLAALKRLQSDIASEGAGDPVLGLPGATSSGALLQRLWEPLAGGPTAGAPPTHGSVDSGILSP
jgi:hypothetical protein